MPDISLVLARPDQKPVIANLIQLYLYDMTEFMPFPVGADGRYAYDFLDRFWRFPYLIMSDDEIAAFALVIDECPLTGRSPCWFMAEFFVLKAYRGRGVARSAVQQALQAHPGQWHIAAPHANHAAQAFWSKTLVPQESSTAISASTVTTGACTSSYLSTKAAEYSGEARPRGCPCGSFGILDWNR